MDSVDVLKNAFSGAHMWYRGTTGDVTPEQANSLPPGVTQPIGALMAHILHCEDVMINQVILGQAALWEKEGWKDRAGGDMLTGPPGGPLLQMQPARHKRLRRGRAGQRTRTPARYPA